VRRHGVVTGLITALALAAPAGHSQSVSAPHGQHNRLLADNEDRLPVKVTADQQARMGIKIDRVEATPLRYVLRAPGVVKTDEGRETHFHTRVSGWIEEIFADSIGKAVQKGQPLFSLYSPDLVTTQNEYVAALQIGPVGREVAETALTRLRYFGVPEREIRDITERQAPKRLITFESPITGFVVEKNAIRGLYVTPEVHLYYLADLSRLWVLATLYEADLAVITIGDRAKITLPYDLRRTYTGKIGFIYPDIEQQTRTGKARIEVKNPEGILKPGSYVNVELTKDLGSPLAVPEDSVIDTGQRMLVFVRSSPTQFEPREIQIGPRVSGKFAVLGGLTAGEEIVTGANFLLDAESKLQAAVRKGAPSPAGHGGHGSGQQNAQ
jgi:membrane fusion protein, copper/silver efflux system